MKITLLAHALAAALLVAAQASAENGSQTSVPHIKEISDVSNIALRVLDKDCPDLVQPFKLSDNLGSLGVFAAKRAANIAKGQLGTFIGVNLGGSGRAEPKISDSTRLAAKQLNWLPMEAEVLYGEREHEKETDVLPRDSKLGKKYYPIADQMLQDLVSGIVEPTDYQFRVFILKRSERNAIARPGGFLYLDQGLLEAEQYRGKAYFALAHEIAHVLQRHETRELQGMVVDSFTAEDELVEVLPKIKKAPALLLDHVKIGKDIFTQHKIDQELQADSCAARLLGRLYEPPELAATLNAFIADLPPYEPAPPPARPKTDEEKLAAVTHDIVSMPLDRHPNSKERKDNLDNMYREITQPAP